VGAYECQLQPCAFCLCSLESGQSETKAVAFTLKRGKDDGRPVTAIIAYDLLFFEKLPKLFPHSPTMRNLFAENPQLVESTARRNSSLQGAYLIIAARARSDWTVDQCRALTMLASTKSFSERVKNAMGASKSSGRPRQVEFPVQPGLRRFVEAFTTWATLRV
jgi:hypothetical protein